MPRYNCKGWLYITVPDDRTLPVRVRMTHEEAHPHYTDISLPERVQDLIIEMKSSPVHQIWAEILRRWGTQDYNQDQVYN